MSTERWLELMKDDSLPCPTLTEAEIKEGWHFCPDWDCLLIGPGMMEVEHCLCPVPLHP